MSALWGTLMVRTNSAASTNPSMEECIGRGFWTWGLTSVFQIWQSVRTPSSSYLPAHGMCGVLRGVRMLLSMDRAAAFTVLGMPAEHGPVSTETGSRKETGD